MAEYCTCDVEACEMHTLKGVTVSSSDLATLRAEVEELRTERRMLEDGAAARDEEITRLMEQLDKLKRPPMTRELPRVEGWYWMKHELTICKPFPVEVFNRNGVMCLQEDGGYYKPVNEYAIAIWSARPLEVDPMPEGEKL